MPDAMTRRPRLWLNSRRRRSLHCPTVCASVAAIDALTPQQLEIAQLAAEGLTNKQIGERLYLSPRTCTSCSPKLGITSRAALRDALNGPQLD